MYGKESEQPNQTKEQAEHKDMRQNSLSEASSSAWTRLLRSLHWAFLLSIALLSANSACTCDTPPVADGGDGGNIVTSDGAAIRPPEDWGQSKMKLGQVCGAYQWGDLACEDGLSCVTKGATRGICLRACTQGGPACPNNVDCQEVSPGQSVCLTTQTLPALGELCSDKPCQPPYSCVKAEYETEDRCRAPCDPSPNAENVCPQGFICGVLPQGGGSCVSEPPGKVEEFGQCGPQDGYCKRDGAPLICVTDATRNSLSGTCLRKCDKDTPCPEGLSCIDSVGACAQTCERDTATCKYGQCHATEQDKTKGVCY